MSIVGWADEVVAEKTVTFNIPQQRADSALTEFAEQADLTLIFPPELVGDKQANELIGTYTQAEGAEILLAGTGLNPTFSNRVVLSIAADKLSANEGDDMNVSKKKGLLATLLAVFTGVNAQDLPTDDQNAEVEALALEEIIVTGSRIARANNTAASPVNTFDQEDIQRAGVGDIGDILNDSPLLRPNVGRRSAGANLAQPIIGATFLDLRGLGSQRTLVLVDGRRHVSSNPGSQAVDVSTIPNVLIERVEILTGGASAVYGSDAVTGVVNFIMRDDFEGLQADVQLGMSNRGDGFEHTYSLTGGINFDGGRGNFTAHYTHFDYDGLSTVDRQDDLIQNIGFFPNPDNTGPDDGIPDFVILGDRNVSLISESGVILAFSPFQSTFDGNGMPVPSDLSGISLGVFQSGGDGLYIDPFTTLSIPSKRDIVYASINYEFNRSAEFFATAKYAHSVGDTTGQPPQDIFVFLSRDNAYITPEIDALLDTAGVPPDGFFNYSRVDSAFLPIGKRRSTRDLFRAVVGIKGELQDQWTYETYAQYGRTDSESFGESRSVSRNRLSLDSVLDAGGNPVCRITIDSPGEADDCVPRNPFGDVPVSDELRGWLAAETAAEAILDQTVVAARITGGLFEVPAGTVDIAVGVEYRHESSEFNPNQLLQDGDDTFAFTGPVLPVSGSFDVYEGFVEAVVPILNDRPYFHDLTLEGAVGVANYSTSGTTDSYGLGANWAPSADFRFRGSLSHSVRAPNIGELFAGESGSGVFPQDPCSVEFINLGRAPENRAANCAALGIPDGFMATSGLFVTQTQGGNPDLESEESDTYSIGLVLTPRALSGLFLAVDYWSIDIDNAISAFPAQGIVDNCVDLDTIDNEFCPRVTRRADNNLSMIEANLINISALEAAGVDIEGQYNFDVNGGGGWGGYFNIALKATYVDKLTIFPNETDPTDFDLEAGEAGDPHWQARLNLQYATEHWEAVWSTQYIGSTTQLLQDDSESFNSTRIGSKTYHDLYARYRLRDNVEFHGGINNIFDNNPPEVPGANLGIPSAAAQDGNVYDNLGRYFFLGASVSWN